MTPVVVNAIGAAPARDYCPPLGVCNIDAYETPLYRDQMNC